MTISFRVQVKVSSGQRFVFTPQTQPDIHEFQLPSGESIFVKPNTLSKSGDDDLLILSSNGYPDKVSACAAAKSSLLRIRLAALKLGIGIEFRPGIHESFATGQLLETSLKYNRQLIQDFGNITIYEDQPPPQFIEMWATMTKTRDISVLLNATSEIPQEIPETVSLAAELHSQSLFEASYRAKFLALITAVEVMSTQSMRSSEECQLLEGLLAQVTNSELADVQKRKLASAIGGLKRQSISDAGTNLVATRLGDEDAERFRHFYALRGKLTHRSALTEIERETNELKSLVERLLVSFL